MADVTGNFVAARNVTVAIPAAVFYEVFMTGFQAIILVCLSTVSQQDCSENNAVDMISTRVANELGCANGWQEIIARGALKEQMNSGDGQNGGTYIKTLCRRIKPEP